MSSPGLITLPPLQPAMDRPCKLCGALAPHVGSVDFNRHSTLDGKPVLSLSHVLVPYNRCSACGFLFSAAFDGWSQDDFKCHIYNSDYALVDPDYETARPLANLTWFEALFEKDKATLRILDYGGGNGRLTDIAREAGFADCSSYDPFVPEHSTTPSGTYQLVSCFETIEHVPQPLQIIETLCNLAGESGLILFSTLLQPEEIERIGLNWWYVVPRNGHISLFSPKSLQDSFNRFGFRVAAFDHNKFLAFRNVPEFARHMFKSWLKTTEQE